MTEKIYNIIKQAFIDGKEALINDVRASVAYNYPIGVDKIISNKKVAVPRYSEKTGRRLKHDGWEYEHMVITEEFFNKKFEAALKNATAMYFKVFPDDSTRVMNIEVTDAGIESIYNALGEYAEHLVKFVPKYVNYFGPNREPSFECMYPVFEDEWDEKFNNALNDYCARKAAWCAKYGCD